jgi:hypothetical protein
MSMVLADERDNPDSLVYYAPPRYRRDAADAGIGPVLERLSRGERETIISPPLLPELSDDVLAPAPDLLPLAFDPFSLIGKAVTLVACVAALTAPGIYYFATGGELHISGHGISTRAPKNHLTGQPAATPELKPVAVKTIAIVPARDEPAAEKEDRQPVTEIAKDEVAEETVEPVAEATMLPGTEGAFPSPLELWLMYPGEAEPAATDDNATTGSAEPAEVNSPPQQTEPPRHARRSHAHAATAQGSRETAASAQSKATRTIQPNPFQAALRAIFTPGRQPPQNNSAGF